MINTDIQPCTVCGAFTNSKFLSSKVSDGRGNDSISLYRCGECNTVYLGKYNESYDDDLYAYYQKYKDRKKEEVYNPLTHKSYMQVLRLIAAHGGKKVILDVGCGKGDFVDAALSEGYDVDGIELSQPAVDIGQGFNLPIAKLDFCSSKIQQASRDVVTMFEVIEHLPEPVKFLQRAEMVVRPGGLVYLTTPNYNSLDRRILGTRWNAIHREHLTYFTPATLLGAIRKNTRLEVLHIETRNVSAELINHFRSLVKRFSRGNKQHIVTEKSGHMPTPDIRAEIEKSTWLQLLKRGVNSLLNSTSLGSTIVVLLRRPDLPTKK